MLCYNMLRRVYTIELLRDPYISTYYIATVYTLNSELLNR